MSNRIKSRKGIIIISAVFAVGLFTIGAGKSDYLRAIAHSQKRFNDVYKYLISNYVDEINVDEFTNESIHDLVGKMDPYTVFMQENEQDGLKMLTNGSYGGVGIQIGMQNKELTVIAPMDDSPASRAGIISGDVITKIDSESTTDMGLSDASEKIRGPKGTNVTLTINRLNIDHPLEYVLQREDIKLNDVAYADTIAPGVGYIRLTQFSRNAPDEMEAAFKYLLDKNVHSIVLDLRDNPGGLLKSAVNILDMIIPKGKTLLSTRGRTRTSNRIFKSEHKPLVPEDVKIAVLINGGSASASEIVTGAIQDLDRGVVIGKSSFGKGLVQSVIDIDHTSAMKITTAKYYIPSGRLIQKPGYVDDKLVVATPPADSVYHTENGRPVKGGGGIHPDEEVNGVNIPLLTQTAWRQGLFFDFVLAHRDDYSDLNSVLKDSASLTNSFETYMQKANVDVHLPGEDDYRKGITKLAEDSELSAKLPDLEKQIDTMINSREKDMYGKQHSSLEFGLVQEFARQLEGSKGRIRISLQKDPVVKQALTTLNDGSSYDSFLAWKN